MAERFVRCATCQDRRLVNGFGRCVVCGSMIADAQLETPSVLRWHLRRNATGYGGLLLLGLAVATFLLAHAGDVPQHVARAAIRILLLVGGALVVHWIKDRLIG